MGRKSFHVFIRRTDLRRVPPRRMPTWRNTTMRFCGPGRNRLAAAVKLLDYLNVDSRTELLTDSCHNYVEQTKEGWLHRKGSVSAGHRAVVIPRFQGEA